ncbi:VWA domain-containing protein [Actinomycetospora sp. SF1]|nr:VWA domain-containing protein [Actinomycetospora soli]
MAAIAIPMVLSGSGDARAAAAVPTTLFVVDTSGSMGGQRLDDAKAALSTAVDALSPGQVAGMRSFAGECGDTGTLVTPLKADNKAALHRDIDQLQAGGGTPTPGSLEAAAADLASVKGPKQIVLISDGQSTCGDPCPVAAQIAQQQGVGFKVHTVGFNAPDTAEGELACIARTTGGQYFSVTDAPGLTGALGQILGTGSPTHEYVAIGDSTTTGFSVPTCTEDRATSAFGCVGAPPATPFPQLVATQGGSAVDDLDRVGIWGYTIHEAVADLNRGKNDKGPWVPQLTAAGRATKLVTVNLGINDMNFSDYKGWLASCVTVKVRTTFWGLPNPSATPSLGQSGNCAKAAEAKATAPALQKDMDAMFTALDAAKAKGAKVVVTKYYNPINDKRQLRFQPDRSCSLLHGIAGTLVGAMNTQLEKRATAHGFTTVDLAPAFVGHGAGSGDSYVFGSECEVGGLLGGAAKGVSFDFDWPSRQLKDVSFTDKKIQAAFDPHPNGKGTQAQAAAVLGGIK